MVAEDNGRTFHSQRAPLVGTISTLRCHPFTHPPIHPCTVVHCTTVEVALYTLHKHTFRQFSDCDAGGPGEMGKADEQKEGGGMQGKTAVCHSEIAV